MPSSTAPMTRNPAKVRQALLEQAGAVVAPILRFPQLTPREDRLLRDGDVDAALARLRPRLLRWFLELGQASPSQLDKYAYGYELQRKALETLLKRALPETLRVEHSGEVRKLSTAELVDLIRQLGLGPPAAHGQITDTPPEAST